MGRALLIEMGFLNMEMDICELILAQNEQKIRDYGVFDPEPLPVPSNATQLTNRRPPQVKEMSPRADMLAAAIPIGNARGALVLVGDFASNSQFQPPQLAADEVTVTLALPEELAELANHSRQGRTPAERASGDRNAAYAQGIRHLRAHFLLDRVYHHRRPAPAGD